MTRRYSTSSYLELLIRYTRSEKQMPQISRPTRYTSLSLKEVVGLCAGPRDDAAWEEFVSRVQRPISLTILRVASLWGGPSAALVQDLVQVTYLKLWEDNCRLLHDFALRYPEAILGYIKKTAANATHDHFKHRRSQTSGGDRGHVSTTDVDPQAGEEVDGSQEKIGFQILLNQIDEHLKRTLISPDQERDRMIFWLYFRQGMSTQEIASMPAIALTAKGVGSVLERLKRCVREHIVGADGRERVEQDAKSKFSTDVVIGLYGVSKYGAATQ
jgi:RNA polymerase sigma-70 factor (ECF subfamily)